MESIKQLQRWICWNAVKKNGRTTKVPCAANGGATGTNETYAHTWVTYDEAAVARALHGYTGVGFVIPGDMFFLDKDHVDLDAPEVKQLLAMFPTYAEASFSGDGVHIYGRCDMERLPVADGKLDKRYYTKNPNNGLEVYIGALTNRFAAFTGKIMQDAPIADCTEALLTLLEEQMLRHKQTQPVTETKEEAVCEDDPRIAEIIESLRWDKNAPKFVRLFDEGDITGYASRSEADAALCAIIAFRAGPNPALIDAIFRRSALYREDKWERTDYRTNTIACGIEARRGVYHHSLREKPSFITINPQNGAESVSATRLAQHIRENLKYIFVQGHAMSSARCYVYQDGAYRFMSRMMMLGVIKQYIVAYDEHLVKTRTLNEVYDLLLTDNFFVSEEDLNADEDIINFQNGLLRLSDILPADVQRVLNSIEGARESKCKVKNILNMIFEQAMDDHLIQRNSMCSRSIRITGRASKPTEPYSVAQMRFLIQNIARVQKPLDKAYIALHALHPMRLEEVLGLKWKDIHFDTMTLHIERAVTHPHRNQPIVKQPKTEASRRTIDLVPQIVRYLQVGAPEDFVLGGQNPLSYTQVRRMCERIQRDTGFEESITPRRFRTTVLTDLYDTTKDIQQARIAAGHTTAAMTLKHYVKGRREHADTAHPIAVVYGLATDANADWQET